MILIMTMGSVVNSLSFISELVICIFFFNLFILMDRMVSPCTQNLYVEALDPKVTVLRDRAVREIIKIK